MKKWNNLLLIITIQIAILLFASVNTSFGEQVVLSIDDTIVIDGDTCVVMNYFMNDSLHSALFLIEQSDTVYCRGVIEYGVPEFDTSIFTPLYPQLRTSWYGMCDGSLFEVDDFLSVSVPAGTFDAYHYSVSGECNEYWQASDGVGIIVIPVEDEFGDEFWVKLSDYTIAGGEGVFPLEVGNRWEYTFVPPESATMRVVNDTTAWGYQCYILDWSSDGELGGTLFLHEEDEVLYVKGFRMPGQEPEEADTTMIFTIQHPVLGDSWYGLHDCNWEIVDAEVITVPAGEFEVYVIELYHSENGQYYGTYNFSTGNGLIRYGEMVFDTYYDIDLTDYHAVGCDGIFPIRVGNFWRFGTLTGITDDFFGLPRRTSLKQNYPNPFNAQTSISYYLPENSDVKLDVYNLLGQHVQTLVNTQVKAGEHSISWDATDMSSGIYFYKLTTGEKFISKRMVLLK